MSTSGPVAVVIPNWNSLEHLSRCIESLHDQGVEVELQVVDNGSTDGSVEYLTREGVAHVALPRNTGFAAAVNLGAKRTESPTILALNADTLLEPGCIATLLDALDEHPRLGGVQPLILQFDRARKTTDTTSQPPPSIYSAGQALTKDGRGIEEAAGEALRSDHLARREIFGVCGAACLLRRELFTELDGYDESYFAFCEDVDLNVRARIAGWGFEIVPEAVVWHVGNAVWRDGFRNPNSDNARLVARNRLATQLKFMPLASVPRIALIEAGSLAKATSQGRLGATLGGKLEALGRRSTLAEERRQLRAGGDLEAARAWLGRLRTAAGGEAPGPREG